MSPIRPFRLPIKLFLVFIASILPRTAPLERSEALICSGTSEPGNMKLPPRCCHFLSLQKRMDRIPESISPTAGLGRTSSTQSTTFEVVKEDKKTPILTVTNSPVTYSGAPQAAIIQSAIIPDGMVPGTIMNVLYNGSATVPANAGTYTVTADFTPEDSDSYFTLTAAPAGNFVINKATPVLSVSNSPVTYDGKPHAAAVSASVPGSASSVLAGGAPARPGRQLCGHGQISPPATQPITRT